MGDERAMGWPVSGSEPVDQVIFHVAGFTNTLGRDDLVELRAVAWAMEEGTTTTEANVAASTDSARVPMPRLGCRRPRVWVRPITACGPGRLKGLGSMASG